jgi:hypothetical protein
VAPLQKLQEATRQLAGGQAALADQLGAEAADTRSEVSSLRQRLDATVVSGAS